MWRLERGEVILEETRSEAIQEPFGDGVILHLKLFSFYQDSKTSSYLDLKNAIEKTREKNKNKRNHLRLEKQRWRPAATSSGCQRSIYQ